MDVWARASRLVAVAPLAVVMVSCGGNDPSISASPPETVASSSGSSGSSVPGSQPSVPESQQSASGSQAPAPQPQVPRPQPQGPRPQPRPQPQPQAPQPQPQPPQPQPQPQAPQPQPQAPQPQPQPAPPPPPPQPQPAPPPPQPAPPPPPPQPAPPPPNPNPPPGTVSYDLPNVGGSDLIDQENWRAGFEDTCTTAGYPADCLHMSVRVFAPDEEGKPTRIDNPGPDYESDGVYSSCPVTAITPEPGSEVDVGTTVVIEVLCEPVSNGTGP
jgi:hypothetical protein